MPLCGAYIHQLTTSQVLRLECILMHLSSSIVPRLGVRISS